MPPAIPGPAWPQPGGAADFPRRTTAVRMSPPTAVSATRIPKMVGRLSLPPPSTCGICLLVPVSWTMPMDSEAESTRHHPSSSHARTVHPLVLVVRPVGTRRALYNQRPQ